MSPPDAERGPAQAPVQSTRHQAPRPPQNTAPLCECQDCTLAQAADRALDGHHIERLGGLLLVPDSIVIEAIANGQDLPTTWRLIRDDGRTVYAFQVPAAAA